MTTQQAEKLLRAAKKWADFQDPDSLEDQKSDDFLRAEAIEARERLIAITEELAA